MIIAITGLILAVIILKALKARDQKYVFPYILMHNDANTFQLAMQIDDRDNTFIKTMTNPPSDYYFGFVYNHETRQLVSQENGTIAITGQGVTWFRKNQQVEFYLNDEKDIKRLLEFFN